MNKPRGYEGYKRSHSKYLYIMENKDYIKIGISFDPNHRCYNLNYDLEDKNDQFVIVKYIDCLDGLTARTLEKHLHLMFRDKQIITDFIGAKTECFCKSIKEDVISKLDELDKYRYYDPFLSCHPKHYRAFLASNNLTVEDVCSLIGKSPTKYAKQAVQLSLCNILANIQTSQDKLLTYAKNEVDNLTSGGVICTRILEELFLSDGVININNFNIPKDIDIRYDVRVGSRLRNRHFTQAVSPLYLKELYSYVNNISEYLTRMIDTKSTLAIYREVLK